MAPRGRRSGFLGALFAGLGTLLMVGGVLSGVLWLLADVMMSETVLEVRITNEGPNPRMPTSAEPDDAAQALPAGEGAASAPDWRLLGTAALEEGLRYSVWHELRDPAGGEWSCEQAPASHGLQVRTPGGAVLEATQPGGETTYSSHWGDASRAGHLVATVTASGRGRYAVQVPPETSVPEGVPEHWVLLSAPAPSHWTTGLLVATLGMAFGGMGLLVAGIVMGWIAG